MTESLGQEYRRSALDGPDEKENPVQDETQQSPDAQSQDPIIGTPEEDAGTWDGRQSFPDTCTIRAQEFIIEQFTGEEVDEEVLVQEATDSGFYTPGRGTTFEHTGSLLEAHGIPVNQHWEATTHDLANELAQGHKVILSVDADELSGQEDPILEVIAGVADRDVNHDVVVSGVDTTDPENPQVIVSDPGTGEVGATYPMDQFLAAWQDSNFFMTATQDPVPETAPEMANFPYDEGHIPEVVSIPYEDFVEMRDQMEEWNELLELIAQYQTYDAPQEAPQETASQDAVNQDAVNQEAINQEAPAQEAPDVQQAPIQEPPVQEAPGQEVVPPELLDASLPGPTLDPGLFDLDAPGPTIDPCLCNPEAPGPTIDPALLDPVEPGLTLDPALLDPNSPGPTLDPKLFDPAAPGLTIDPYAPLPPDLAQSLQNTNVPVAFTQNPVEQTSTESGTGGGADPDISPGMQGFLDGINQRQQQAAQVSELIERASNGDAEAQAELDRTGDAAQRQTSMLEGRVSGQEVSNGVAPDEQEQCCDNQEHQEAIDVSQTDI